MKQTLLFKKAVVCDYREDKIAKILEKLGLKVAIANLEIGDFVISERTIIERKTHSDFISSIIDGRIFDQVKRMKEEFEKVIIIIEGYSNRKINENSLKAAIATLALDEAISLIETLNPLDTAKMIYWLAKKEGKKEFIAFKAGKKKRELKELQEQIICSLPGISLKTAKKLLKYFGNVERIFKASETELMKIKGIGEKTARKIKKVISAKYE